MSRQIKSIPTHLRHQQPSPIAVCINAIYYPKFIDDRNSSPLITNPPSCLPDLLDSFCTTLRSLLDHHAPLLIKTNKSSALLLLLGSPLKSSVSSLSAVVWNAPTSPHTLFFTLNFFGLLPTATVNLYPSPKSFYASLVQSSSSKPRALWKTINNVLHITANRSVPTSFPLAALSQLFATHFSNKISKLHLNLQTDPSSTPDHSLPPSYSKSTINSLNHLIHTDPVPTTVLKNISSTISPTILSVVNLSITTDTFHSTLK